MVVVLLLCFMPMFELYDHTRVAMGDKVKLAPLHEGRQNRPRLHHSGGLQDRKLGKLPTSVPIRPRPCISATFSSSLSRIFQCFIVAVSVYVRLRRTTPLDYD
jgi:hypothetical protein